MDDGVSLLFDPRLMEEVGLSGACGREGAEAVWLVLTLEAVTGRLAELSGVLAARTYDGRGAFGEPMDETEANEEADPIASGWIVDQASEAALASDRSLEVDLRSAWPNVWLEREFIGDLSFIDAVEGELESLNAFVKLHFLEGVLRRGGAEAVDRYP